MHFQSALAITLRAGLGIRERDRMYMRTQTIHHLQSRVSGRIEGYRNEKWNLGHGQYRSALGTLARCNSGVRYDRVARLEVNATCGQEGDT